MNALSDLKNIFPPFFPFKHNYLFFPIKIFKWRGNHLWFNEYILLIYRNLTNGSILPCQKKVVVFKRKKGGKIFFKSLKAFQFQIIFYN